MMDLGLSFPDTFLTENDIPNYRLSFVGSPDKCHRCGSMVWRIISQSGFEVRLDPERLTPQDDLDLYLRKRMTYTCYRVKNGFEANFRHSLDLKAADYSRNIYLAAHTCDPHNIRTRLIDWWRKY